MSGEVCALEGTVLSVGEIALMDNFVYQVEVGEEAASIQSSLPQARVERRCLKRVGCKGGTWDSGTEIKDALIG